MSWIIWAIFILIVSSALNTLQEFAPKKITSDPIAHSLWGRCFIIIAGIISLISLFLPKIGMDQKSFKIIKENINWNVTIGIAFVLTFLFSTFPIAVSEAGAVAVAIMNLNFVVQLIFNVLFKGAKPSQMEIFGSIAFVASVIFLAYEKNKSKSK